MKYDRLDGAVPGGLLRELVAGSHRLIPAKLPKYVRKEIETA